MTRQRIEDLGRIAQMTHSFLLEDSPMDQCTSKHTVKDFIEFCKNEENAEYLHRWLRSHKEFLELINSIAWGTDEMNWTISGSDEHEF